MARSDKSIDEKLEALSNLDLGNDPKRDQEALKMALSDANYRIVAKAADLSGEQLLYDMDPLLRDAYQRLLQDPVKRDPTCFAKRAIARALVALDCANVAFFLEGLRYRQMEPTWGGSVDTAVDVRNSCAMGLVACGYSRALHEVTLLLNDSEARARQGAVRAIACGIPREAELLLRLKILLGDSEPEVIGECFAGLLSAAPDESVAFVEEYLSNSDAAVCEHAALALGESRRADALACLQKAWDNRLVAPEFRRALIRAVALHRSDAAFDWLIAILARDNASLAEATLEALAIYKHNDALANRIKVALEGRKDGKLNESFARLWA